MTWIAVAGAGTSLLGGIIGGKRDKKIAQSMRTTLGNRNFTGAGGFGAFAGDEGTGFNLGQMNAPFMQQLDFGRAAGGLAQNALFNVPGGVQRFSDALDMQDPDIGTFLQGQRGGSAFAARSLADAFGGGFDPTQIANRQLGLLRAQAAPQEAMDRRSFIGDLYSTGRGAVTGAPGAEGTMGGGRLAAAFAQGQSRADIDRQITAQETGINAANASENLLRSAFGRFTDASTFASDNNNAMFNRIRGMNESGYNRQVQMAGLPASIAAAFQQLAGSGFGQAANFQGLGLDAAGQALNTATASANARIGSASNVANFMNDRSSTPGLDGLSSFLTGIARPTDIRDAFGGLFKRGDPNPAASRGGSWG